MDHEVGKSELTQLGYKVSSKKPCAPKNRYNMPRDGTVPRRTIGNDRFLWCDGQVAETPLNYYKKIIYISGLHGNQGVISHLCRFGYYTLKAQHAGRRGEHPDLCKYAALGIRVCPKLLTCIRATLV
jgi:hypothetical protein